ncbi:MAG: hypothetical protein KAJ19_22835 [Gammaproteobacteria bacterium]|nr:hypothetical protein [Gammaproteobacteria bacterium]
MDSRPGDGQTGENAMIVAIAIALLIAAAGALLLGLVDRMLDGEIILEEDDA